MADVYSEQLVASLDEESEFERVATTAFYSEGLGHETKKSFGKTVAHISYRAWSFYWICECGLPYSRVGVRIHEVPNPFVYQKCFHCGEHSFLDLLWTKDKESALAAVRFTRSPS